jgi:hypothetical protein
MARNKLPKWAIKQAGGINKKAWRLARRGRKSTRKGQVRKTARRAFTRRNNPTRKRTMRKSKNLNVNVVELGGGLVLADQILGTKGMSDLFSGNFRGAVTTAAQRFRTKSTQEDLIKTGLGIVVIKAAAKSLGERRLGKIGPLVLKA